MKSIVIFGAGKSATCLIEYLETETVLRGWNLTVADGNLELVQSKLRKNSGARAVALNVEDQPACAALVASADVVISLLPPHLHLGIAKACLQAGKHLLTASYIDPEIEALRGEIGQKNLLFLCEMGLDPGIDHMSAMQLIASIRDKGGKLTSFQSHCGGLVAPESDDNPWHYKISWNPRNIVQAGKSGARYRQHGGDITLAYKDLFDPKRVVDVPGLGTLAWYPNRDSLSYSSLYHMEDTATFIRTTLRYPEFCFGWKNVIDLNLTDETPCYETDGMTLKEFFKLHFSKNGFADWMADHFTIRNSQTRDLLEKLQELIVTEDEMDQAIRKEILELIRVDQQGNLDDQHLDNVNTQATEAAAIQMKEASLALRQLMYLGMADADTVINKGKCSALDVLQFCLEKKLALKAQDKDMIVMLHELEYELAGQPFRAQSTLIVKGRDQLRTAMAQTVGLPLGIAATLILQGNIGLRGLHIPIHREIYEPVLEALKAQGIHFIESA